MMGGFVKVYGSIAESSISEEALHVRWFWVIMLAKANRYGQVYGTPQALARAANLTAEQATEALDRLSAPDPNSTSPDEDGRRIVAISPNLWQIVNHAVYRNLRDPDAERERKRVWWAEKGAEQRRARRVLDAASAARQNSTHSKGRSKGKENDAPAPATAGRGRSRVPYPADFEEWFALYRKVTGRGSTKKESADVWSRLSLAERGEMPSLTREWFDRCAKARAAGVFIAAAPDPVRFLKNCRWEDKFDLPEEATSSESDNDIFVKEQVAHGDDPRWPDYDRAVTSGTVAVGFMAYVESRTREGVQP